MMLNAKMKRKIRKIFSPIRRINLKNKDFTIISNNCWGGIIYDIYGLQYKTPTIGLYFFSKDYIKFLSNLTNYLEYDAIPISLEESKYREYFMKKNIYPMLGKIGDIEVVFVHYENSKIACEKWNKRKKRINLKNLLIKYNDQNLFSIDDYNEFEKLDFKNKIFITGNQNIIGPNVYVLEKYIKYGYAVDDIKESIKKIKIKKLLNSLEK